MKIIVGLGNPGAKYANTRHNVGFMVVDKIKYQKSKIKIIKPTTFMNRSGEAVKHYKAEDLIVIHDDVDLPLGTIRVRFSGSTGGHKGVQSIIDTVGEDFWRVRIGVNRPPEGVPAEQYVLKQFNANEEELLNKTIDQAANLVINFLKSGFRNLSIRI